MPTQDPGMLRAKMDRKNRRRQLARLALTQSADVAQGSSSSTMVLHHTAPHLTLPADDQVPTAPPPTPDVPAPLIAPTSPQAPASSLPVTPPRLAGQRRLYSARTPGSVHQPNRRARRHQRRFASNPSSNGSSQGHMDIEPFAVASLPDVQMDTVTPETVPNVMQRLFAARGEPPSSVHQRDVFGGDPDPADAGSSHTPEPDPEIRSPSQSPQRLQRARVIGGTRRRNATGTRSGNVPDHPPPPGMQWCSHYSGRREQAVFHCRPLADFVDNSRSFLQCRGCRNSTRISNARAQQSRRDATVQASLHQQNLPADGSNSEPVVAPTPLPVLPPNPTMGDPAISDDDKELLQKFRDAVMAIQIEECEACREEWFDLGVKDGKCKKCQKGNIRFTTQNNMDPGELFLVGHRLHC